MTIDNKQAEYRYYSDVDTAFVGSSIKVVDVPASNKEDVGYTLLDNNNYIFVNYSHPIMDDLTDEQKVVFRCGVNAHELLHILLTNSAATEKYLNALPESERGIFLQMWNIMEDPAIEYHGSQEIGGDLIDSLRFSISYIYKKSKPIQSYPGGFAQFVTACIHFGDMGALKGYFTDDDARNIFKECAPIIYQCIEEPDAEKRLLLAKDVFEITRPLWQATADMQDLLQQLAEIMKENGKDKGVGQGRAIIKPVRGKSASKKANQLSSRRKEILSNLSEEDKKNSGNNDLGDDDLDNSYMDFTDVDDDIDEEDMDSSTNSEDEETENSDDSESNAGSSENSDSGNNSKNNSDEDANGDDNCSDDSDKENSESNSNNDSDDEDENGESNSSDSQDKNETDTADGKMPEIDMTSGIDADTSYETEVSQEEYEIPECVIESILKKITEEKTVMEKSIDEIINDDTPVMEPVLTSPLWTGKIKCNNKIIKNSRNAMASEEAYGIMNKKLSGLIRILFNQLHRIFIQDMEEIMYRSSGKVDMKRICSGRATAKMFYKKKEPSNKSNMVVALLFDCSGSMGGNKINAVKELLILLSEVFAKLNIPVYIMGYSESGGVVEHRHYIRWNNTRKERLKLIEVSTSGCNFDGYSVRYMTEILKNKEAEHKLLIALSDGAPASEHYKSGTSNAVNDTRNAIKEAKKIASVLGVAIGDSHLDAIKYIYERDFLHITNVEEMTTSLAKAIKKIVSKWE